MTQPAIRCKGISKQYRIGQRERCLSLRDALASAAQAPFRRIGRIFAGSDGQPSNRDATIWALKDVSFEIQRGEVVGIIGRNGAGKSTLLKVLSRITEPTLGRIEIRGRVGSLLEVGTGFHGELTGRENTFLNGAILGMPRAEIARKFDEIVAFSGVEKFIDTPVKHYSSGMYVRLAFAVAAHLETEVLFVDEVLAVGDGEFTKKCLGKMSEVARRGRTILFVSHNVAAVTRLCNRCILLELGTVLKEGATHDVMSTYLRSQLATSASREWNTADAPGDSVVRLRAVRARSTEGRVADAFDIRHPIGIDVVFDVLESGQTLSPNLHIFNEQGVNVFVSIDADLSWRGQQRPVGRYISTAWIPGNFLAEGTCVVGVAITTIAGMKVRLEERDVIAFQVIDSTDGSSARGEYAGHLPGIVRPLLNWETSYEPEPQEWQSLGETARGEKVL